MKTLKKYKILQILIGVFVACLILSVGLLMTSIATWEQLPLQKVLPQLILIAYPLMFTATMSFIALVAKANDLKYLYYPVFFINIICVVSAILHYLLDETFFLLLIPFSKTLGLPFSNFATAVNEKMTYTVNYDGWREEYSIIYEFEVLMIFLLCLLVSVAVYQLYKETDEHARTLSHWRLENPARILAISSICFYGTFVVGRMIFGLLDGVTYSVEGLSIIYEIIGVVFMVFWLASLLLTISGMIIILPTTITIALLITCIVKAIKTSNLRQFFNPLVLLAIILSILGSYMMYTFTMSGF